MDFSVSSSTTVSLDVSAKWPSHYTSATPESFQTGYSDTFNFLQSSLLFSSKYVLNSSLSTGSSPSVSDLHNGHNIGISMGNGNCNTKRSRCLCCHSKSRQNGSNCQDNSVLESLRTEQHMDIMDSHMSYSDFETPPAQEEGSLAKALSAQLVSTLPPSEVHTDYQVHQLLNHSKLLSPSVLDKTTRWYSIVPDGAMTAYNPVLDFEFNSDIKPSNEYEESQLQQELRLFQKQHPHHLPHNQQPQQNILYPYTIPSQQSVDAIATSVFKLGLTQYHISQDLVSEFMNIPNDTTGSPHLREHIGSLNMDYVLDNAVVEPKMHTEPSNSVIDLGRGPTDLVHAKVGPRMRIDVAHLKLGVHNRRSHVQLENTGFIKDEDREREMAEKIQTFDARAKHLVQQTQHIQQQQFEPQVKVKEASDERGMTGKGAGEVQKSDETENVATVNTWKDVKKKDFLPAAKQYLCKKCLRSFNSNSNLTSHLRCHLDKNEQVGCQFCEKYFKRRNDLERHKYTHHFKLKLVCSGTVDGEIWGCGMVYSRRDALVKHWNGRGKKCLHSFQTLQRLPERMDLKDLRRMALENITQPR